MVNVKIIIIILILLFIIILLSVILSINYKRSNFQLLPLRTSLISKKSQKIPKIIWQIALGLNRGTYKLDDFLPVINKLKLLNKEYKYYLITDDNVEEFILENYNEKILKIFKMINPSYGPAQSDFLRYLIMYAKGGIYFDLKSCTKIPLREIIDNEDECLLSSWGDFAPQEHILKTGFGEYEQWWLASVPKHIIFKNVIDSCIHNILNYKYTINNVGKDAVLRMTGPICFTFAIKYLIDSGMKNYSFKPDNYNKKLIYNCLSMKNPFSHTHIKVFKKHYSTCKEPLILNDTFDWNKNDINSIQNSNLSIPNSNLSICNIFED